MRYDDLIWDFDGTLFDTYPPMCRALRLAMEKMDQKNLYAVNPAFDR